MLGRLLEFDSAEIATNRVLARSGHAGRPFAVCGLIVSAASIATIGTRLPVHGVFAAIPEQSILARATLQYIVPSTSVQLVVAAAAV